MHFPEISLRSLKQCMTKKGKGPWRISTAGLAHRLPGFVVLPWDNSYRFGNFIMG